MHCFMGQTDRQTDGRIASLLNASPWVGNFVCLIAVSCRYTEFIASRAVNLSCAARRRCNDNTSRLIRMNFNKPAIHGNRVEGQRDRWYDFVRNSEASLRTGLAHVSDRITRGRNAIFGHVARLSDNTPAN